MAFLPYGGLLALFDEIADLFHEEGEFEVLDREDGRGAPMRISFYFNRDAFIVTHFARRDNPSDFVRIAIAGGGGVGARPDPALFQYLLMRSMSFAWGGPIVEQKVDGTITYGSQVSIPSTLISEEDPTEGRDFIMGMIRVMGETGRGLGTEAVPQFGGTLLDGTNNGHALDLLHASLGQLEDPAATPAPGKFQIIWRDFLLGTSHDDAAGQALINIDSGTAIVLTVIENGKSPQYWDGQKITDYELTESRTPDPGEYEVSWLIEISASNVGEAATEASQILTAPEGEVTFIVTNSAGIKKVVYAYAS